MNVPLRAAPSLASVLVVVPVLLVVAGVAGLAWFGWLVWPPLAVLVVSVACLVAGLLVDWEVALGGKPAQPPPR